MVFALKEERKRIVIDARLALIHLLSSWPKESQKMIEHLIVGMKGTIVIHVKSFFS